MKINRKAFINNLIEYQAQGYKYLVKAKNISKSTKETNHNDFFVCRNEIERDNLIRTLESDLKYRYIEHYPIYAHGIIYNTFNKAKSYEVKKGVKTNELY